MTQLANVWNIRKYPVGLTLLLGAYCYVLLFSSLNMLVGYFLSDEMYTFRADNFWSFSSGIFRRAFVGQLIYYLDVITGYGPVLYSLTLWSLFLLVTYCVYKECWRTLPKSALLVLMVSPLVLIYQVDSEVLLFLPCLYLLLSKSKPNYWVLLFLTALVILVREIALILYLPLLISIFMRGRVGAKGVVVLVVCSAVFTHLYKAGDPSFMLEKEFWPSRGITDIESHFLYYFIDKSLFDVLALHFGYMAKDGFIFLPGLLSFLCIVLGVIYSRCQSSFVATFFVASLLVISFLTIDYGRYFYFFFYFAILISHPRVALYFKLDHLPAGLIRMRDKLSLPVGALSRFLSKNNRVLLALCLVFALSPCGFSAGEYSFSPRFYVMAEVIYGYL